MKDLEEIKKHWEDFKTVSLKDDHLRQLEQEKILSFLSNLELKSLQDIGCGDAGDTIKFSGLSEKIYAYDYSNSMLDKARKKVSKYRNIHIDRLDILIDPIPHISDAIITKRMLINLGSFSNQKEAIKKIHSSLNNSGYFIMLETCIEGLNNLNSLREKYNLTKIPEPFHNSLFNLTELKLFLEPFFEIKKLEFFSTYFFLTRIYNPSLEYDKFEKFDKTAKAFSSNINLFPETNIGPQFCMLLKKK